MATHIIPVQRFTVVVTLPDDPKVRAEIERDLDWTLGATFGYGRYKEGYAAWTEKNTEQEAKTWAEWVEGCVSRHINRSL